MTNRIDEIADRIQALEAELTLEMIRRKETLAHDFEEKRIQFEREVAEQQKRFKMGLLKYLWTADLKSFIAAPFIYALIAPLIFLDIFVSLYQAICFPLFGIQKAKRSDYIVFDRAHLAYLNFLEKINCAYCSYGNGLIAYTREIAGKTEQYWCPIKHAKRVYLSHPYYSQFAEYGDAAHYQEYLKKLRKQIAPQHSKNQDD